MLWYSLYITKRYGNKIVYIMTKTERLSQKNILFLWRFTQKMYGRKKT